MFLMMNLSSFSQNYNLKPKTFQLNGKTFFYWDREQSEILFTLSNKGKYADSLIVQYDSVINSLQSEVTIYKNIIKNKEIKENFLEEQLDSCEVTLNDIHKIHNEEIELKNDEINMWKWRTGGIGLGSIILLIVLL